MSHSADNVADSAGPANAAGGNRVRLPLVDPDLTPQKLPRAGDLLQEFLRAIEDAITQRRLLVAVPFCVIGGLLVNAALPRAPEGWALALLGLLLAALLVGARNGRWSAPLLAMALCAWGGLSLLNLHGALWGTQMLAYPAYGTYQVTVDEVISADSSAQRLVVSRIAAMDDARTLPVRRARLFVRGSDRFERGDVLRGAFRFAPVPGPITPGGFDFQFHSYFDGIGAFGNATGQVSRVAEGGGWQRAFDSVRRGIGERIDGQLELPQRGIARALIIGDQTLISDETRTMMASAGLAHVLAISGLHLTLVAGGVFAVLRAGLALFVSLSAIVPAKKLAALAGAATAICYLLLSGASVSATRATLMLLLVFGAVLVGRRALTMRNVAIAAIVLILIDPASVFRPSFQLSFAAVTALIAVYETRPRRDYEPLNALRRLWRYVWGMALTSLVAGLATLVFAAYHFQQTAPLGVLGNVLALPIVGFVVLPAGVVSVLLMPLGMEGVFLDLMAQGIALILSIARAVSNLSTGLNASLLLEPLALLAALFALAWLALFTGKIRYAGIAFAVPAIVLFGTGSRPDVLLADSSQAIAVMMQDNMGLIAGRAPSFATDAWSQTYSVLVQNGFEGLSCDNAACIGTSPQGFAFALVRRSDAFAEECLRVDLIVTRLYAPSWCRQTAMVKDQNDIRTNGVTALYWQSSGVFAIKNAITNPQREWRVR